MIKRREAFMLTVQQEPTEEQFTTAFQQADEGEVRAAGFCHAAAMSAVLALGSAGLAFLAAGGGAVSRS